MQAVACVSEEFFSQTRYNIFSPSYSYLLTIIFKPYVREWLSRRHQTAPKCTEGAGRLNDKGKRCFAWPLLITTAGTTLHPSVSDGAKLGGISSLQGGLRGALW